MPNQQPNYSFECPGYIPALDPVSRTSVDVRCFIEHSFTIDPGREGSRIGPRSEWEPDERPEIDGPAECPVCGQILDHAEILAKALRERKEGEEP